MRDARGDRGDAELFETSVEGPGSAVLPAGGPSPWPSVAVNGELARARREWLHTNGAGAYASSTLANMHTRRYHGLLVAALDPPRGRHVFLSHVDATILRPRGTAAGPSPIPSSRPGVRPSWELAKHQFPGVDPEGGKPLYLQRFDQDPLPRWTYAAGGGELEVTLALVRGENALVLRYQWRGPHPVELSLRPLIAARNFHNLQREHGGMLQRVELRPPAPDSNPGRASERVPRASQRPPSGAHKHGEMRVQPRRELPRPCFRYEGTFVGSPDWWRRFEYLVDHERGVDFEEDLWTPGVFEVPLDEHPSWLVAGVEHLPEGHPEELLELARDALLAEDPGPFVPLPERCLTIAAERFRADLAPRPGVIAGYPALEVWGRDALMALPGLYLVTKRVEGALRILRELIGAMADGLVPSRFPEPPSPTVNGAAASAASAANAAMAAAPDFACADSTLWLFEAVRHVADALGDDHPTVTGELRLALRDAFEATLRGTRNGIHLTEGGLFAAGKPGDALTWMAARVKGQAVTSRAGCPIELSALWARATDTLARLARAAGDGALHARAAAECRRTRAAFRDRFWCDETGYPYDVVSETAEGEGAFRDPSVRPNAVLALAVDPGCFPDGRARLLLARARRDLVTPAGLRTLSPSDPRYVGRLAGRLDARDGASHQGAVRPWLLGFYARAALRAGTEDRASLERLVLAAARTELGFGLVSELADGDAPHHSSGSVAQAVNVAELLRVLAWDLGRGDPRG